MLNVRICLILFFFLAISSKYSEQGNYDFENLLKQCKESYSKIDNYRYTLYKKELVDDKYIEEKNILLKFMKPMNYYMKWREGKNEGVEVIYAKNKNNDKLLVHLNGLFNFLTIPINPRGSLAMRNNRHSILDSGLGNIINLLDYNYNLAKNNDEVNIQYLSDTVLDERRAFTIEARFPEGKNYYGHKVIVYIDSILYLPIKITLYGWKNELLEEYLFSKLEINCGLTEKDFDRKNPEYDF